MDHYNRIADSLTWLAEHHRQQPSLSELAARASLSEAYFQKIFTEWAGVSPKKFLQHLTLESARESLDARRSVLDASLDAGLSGPSRLHDLFVNVEAMSPGEYKSGGAGLDIAWGFHPSPLGQALLMLSPRGVTAFAFVCDESPAELLSRLQQRLPNAQYHQDIAATGQVLEKIFGQLGRNAVPSGQRGKKTQSIALLLGGTDFQLQVWRALLDIPPGACSSYTQIAGSIGRPKAQRAVGTAVGHNPVAVLIPCHRVIRQTGVPGGYRWGSGRKLALLGFERLAVQSGPEAAELAPG